MKSSEDNSTRRSFLQKCALTVEAIAIAEMPLGKTLASQQAKRAAPSKSTGPSIVFVHTDSWDGRILGCLGHRAVKKATPNIDRLARRGTVFRNTYCSHPICCPSRANMWSGTYTHRCESWNNYKGLDENAETVMTHLRKAGYRLAWEQGGYGKHDYTSGGHSQLARVTAWTGPADIQLPVYRMEAPRIVKENVKRLHARDWEDVDKAKRFLGRHANNRRPFFLYVGIRSPHAPFTTSQKWLDMVDRNAVTVPPEDTEIHPVMKYQRITKNWMHGFSRETVLRTRAIYYAMCAETDAMVGEVLDETDRLGLAENTYFIFSSDHGENNMEHRQFYKMNMYESSVRVPLVIAGPGVKRGVTLDNIVSLIDIYPTLMDMANLKCPPGLDGESLMPLLQGKTNKSRNWALATFIGTASNTTMFMLRKDRWKYIAYPGYEPQLFNLADDPDEINNLARLKPEIVRQFDADLRRIIDYEQVHRRCMEYNRKSFLRWREEVKAHPIALNEYGANKEKATYDEIMANCYIGWTPEHEAKLERWLKGL
ncbi:MAG: sulfatase-like hydrolase/transferase [Planctomycetota bacterium]